MSRSWCFTINNPTTDDLTPLLDDWDLARFCNWQKECVTTPHLQGYIEFKRFVKLGGVKKKLPTAHLEPRRGTQAEAIAYVNKEDTRIAGPWVWGEKGNQGERKDLSSACSTLSEFGIKRVAQDHPEVYVKYHKGLKALAVELDEVKPDELFVPRPWQQQLLDLLLLPADDRHIIWVRDSTGNQGKSRLAKHLVTNFGGIVLTGKKADMAYAYAKEPVVIFDVCRTEAENMSHLFSMAEHLKNGLIFSNKYESVVKIFKSPHVLFFSNSMPVSGCWSADRVKLIDLDVTVADQLLQFA